MVRKGPVWLGKGVRAPRTGRRTGCSAWLRLLLSLLVVVILGGTPEMVFAQQTVASQAGPLASTELLTLEGDLASELVAGVDRFLLAELAAAENGRSDRWRLDFSSQQAYLQGVEAKRQRLRELLGLRDPLTSQPEMRIEATTEHAGIVGQGGNYEIIAVSWPAFGNVRGSGLLLRPRGPQGFAAPVARVIALPDCEVSPEQLVGLEEGVFPGAQYARRLAENGCEVLVPLLINRHDKLPGLSNREWLYRPAFELGRGLVAYELQKILAAVNWFKGRRAVDERIGLIGWGEGGMLALYAGALATEVDVVGISGYFDSRQSLWTQPIDRNVFGLLSEFGDAELAGLILPRGVVIDAASGPVGKWSGQRGAPWQLESPPTARVREELEKVRRWADRLDCGEQVVFVESTTDTPGLSERGLQAFWNRLVVEQRPLADLGELPSSLGAVVPPEVRMQQQIAELDEHNQWLLRESHYVRQQQTVGRLDFSSLAAYENSTAALRDEFYDQVIGRFDRPLLEARPRSRVFLETDSWTAYEIVLDVFPEVMAYGLLLVPKDLQPGERRPVVVCQHGLEGRPQDTIGQPGSQYYSAFAAKLAERGFVTFAPQNLYIFGDRFRTLQRKANVLGKTLFSVITPQHQQIVDWLQTLEFVDPERIGFYGLSYGGKTAMRVPAIVTDYCLSICSADFNEWVDKNASTRNPRTYANMGEYEIFEFDLGSRFNYAEMAALIAPRPFMVERGHEDGVADDWTVAYEYAKVRYLYASKLKRPELTEIEWFDGPHKIHGQKTFDFLHRHLNWPPREETQK